MQEKTSPTIWVKFPIARSEKFGTTQVVGQPSNVQRDTNTKDLERRYAQDAKDSEGAAIVIWTTTPWTIPGNRAISYSNSIAYGLYEVSALEPDLQVRAVGESRRQTRDC